VTTVAPGGADAGAWLVTASGVGGGAGATWVGAAGIWAGGDWYAVWDW